MFDHVMHTCRYKTYNLVVVCDTTLTISMTVSKAMDAVAMVAPARLSLQVGIL